jgi:hypothetical protein
MLLTRLQLAIIGGLAAILLVIAAVQTVRLHGFLWIDGALDKLADCNRDKNELRAELQRISSAKDEQSRETGRNIDKARDNEAEAGRVAERIRNAPIEPGACKTPVEIMRAEI